MGERGKRKGQRRDIRKKRHPVLFGERGHVTKKKGHDPNGARKEKSEEFSGDC